MGLVFELEESDFSGYIEEGTPYGAVVTNVRLREKPFKDERTGEPVRRVEFAFKLKSDDGHDARDIWGDTSTRFNNHPECVVEGTPVLPIGHLLGATKALYEGPVVRLVTRAGERLTVTMNHPVLTGRGWLPACEVREGDEVLCHRYVDPTRAREDLDHMPAPVEEVFDAIRAIAPHSLVAASSSDFHGDGERVQGDVDVVGADGPLQYRVEIGVPQNVEEAGLVGGARLGHAPDGVGAQGLALGADVRAAAGGVGTVNRHRVVATVSHSDPSFAKTIQDRDVSAAQLLADLHESGARSVELDHVVSVQIEPWSGHVYNLHTTSNAYFAEGIATHNCRLRAWSEALLGVHLPAHYRLDTDSLIDRRCIVVVGKKEWQKDGETKVRNFVREVLPTKDAMKSIAASTADEPF